VTSITFPRLRPVAGGVVLLTVLALAGCGGKQMGTVSGKVTYGGKAVTSGEVQFIESTKGSGASGKLDENGAYTLNGQLEAGTYTVFVQPPTPEQLPPGQKPKAVAPFTVPIRYQTPSTSPVKKEVKAGKNDIPIDLTG
jgi:hypothetical protein